jgi:CBS domain-containing protein
MSTQAQLRTVGQVMRQPTTIEPDAHLAAAAYVIEHLRDRTPREPALVVTDAAHRPVAMITDAEITRAVAHGRNLESTRVSQVVPARLVTVRADATAEDAARLMLSQGVHHLPVVEDHRLVGMVDLRDLYRVRFPAG